MSTLTLRSQIRENHLTCAICFNKFTKPKALPCLHTYCEHCLREYIVSRGYEGSGSFPCPLCMTITKMPETGVEGFPDNHLMLSLSDTVESGRPVPKPRRSLGQPQPRREDDEVSPPPYASVADTNPEVTNANEGCSKTYVNDVDPDWMVVPRLEPIDNEGCSKLCVNDMESDWMMVSRQEPSAPAAHDQTENLNLAEFSVTPVEHPGKVPTLPPSNIGGDALDSNAVNPSCVPAQPPPYNPYPSGISTSLPVYPDLRGLATADSSVDPYPASIGWNMNAATPISNVENRNNDSHTFDTHTPRENPPSHILPRSRSVHYPSVPPVVEYNSVACTENLMLKFGKQGASVRDFLKPVGLAVSKEGSYIISDSSGDHDRIFIFNSGGELTAAFKCGCKIKDVTVANNNEILAAVRKNATAIRQFTMAGQFKGEYGKFFTYEVACGIAALKNGGVVLTGTQCVYVLTDQMKLATKFGRKGNGDGYFQQPGHVAVDSKNHIIITDKVNNNIQVFGKDGKFKLRFGSAGSSHGKLQAPLGVCVDDDDNIIVADSGNSRVEVFSSKGRWISSVVRDTHKLGEKVKPVNVAVTPTGKVAVLLRGPYFAEVRIYTSKHREFFHRNDGSSHRAVGPCW